MQKSYFSEKKINRAHSLIKDYGLLIAMFAIFTFSNFSVNAQSQVSSDIISALSKGDSERLVSYFDNSVELAVENYDDNYNKQQASSIVADFFKKNTVSSFQIIHKGNKDSACFVIGTLKTSNHRQFRVYVLTRGAQSQIQQLRIENSND